MAHDRTLDHPVRTCPTPEQSVAQALNETIHGLATIGRGEQPTRSQRRMMFRFHQCLEEAIGVSSGTALIILSSPTGQQATWLLEAADTAMTGRGSVPRPSTQRRRLKRLAERLDPLINDLHLAHRRRTACQLARDLAPVLRAIGDAAR